MSDPAFARVSHREADALRRAVEGGPSGPGVADYNRDPRDRIIAARVAKTKGGPPYCRECAQPLPQGKEAIRFEFSPDFDRTVPRDPDVPDQRNTWKPRPAWLHLESCPDGRA